jgi:hypothetical protein
MLEQISIFVIYFERAVCAEAAGFPMLKKAAFLP